MWFWSSNLRFETEDKASRLLSNVSFLLKSRVYFFGITPEKVIAKNYCFWICVFFFFFLFLWLLLHLFLGGDCVNILV
ncbi:hypothetical protein E1A91_D03G086700v1 [Gossypium mustelinum]|uniref:Uncharacterized protein n=1 Tax=Gossypium mustelinum TaxID=34275 RepID=A0A5D2VKD3_GOSMU|nr:hypothetical protein E1A91_D03G086700v1 [Gossypium mustelinum]